MGVARQSNPPFWEGRVKKLPVAAFLTPQLPSLSLEPLQNLANLHSIRVSKRAIRVNAEWHEIRRCNPSPIS